MSCLINVWQLQALRVLNRSLEIFIARVKISVVQGKKVNCGGTVQYGTARYAYFVNRYRTELKRTEPCQVGPANPSVLAQYGTVN